jgi:3-dehydroquinate synthase
MALGFPDSDAARVLRCLGALGFPLGHRALREDVDTLFDGLEEFRQHLGGRLTITLLRGVGEPVDVHEIDRGLMRAAIERVARSATAAGAVGPDPASRAVETPTLKRSGPLGRGSCFDHGPSDPV